MIFVLTLVHVSVLWASRPAKFTYLPNCEIFWKIFNVLRNCQVHSWFVFLHQKCFALSRTHQVRRWIKTFEYTLFAAMQYWYLFLLATHNAIQSIYCTICGGINDVWLSCHECQCEACDDCILSHTKLITISWNIRQNAQHTKWVLEKSKQSNYIFRAMQLFE